MKPIRLAAWKEGEGEARAKILADLGFDVVFEPLDPGGILKAVTADPPVVLVIDLDRGPAAGRDVGVAVRVRASTRSVALVFAGGVAEKVDRVRSLLPDAEFAPWEEIGPAVERALEEPPNDPVVPDSALAGYSGTPLPKKLGIKPSSRVLLVGAPSDFPDALGTLPDGARLLKRFGPSVDLILWFVTSCRELKRGLETWVGRTPRGGIWIVWPKKSSGVATDLQQAVVRKAGLSAGLVDYKIAAIDQTWSGLKFSVRPNERG
jgi:hypothetical protein